MKRTVAFVLIVLSLLTLCACAGKQDKNDIKTQLKDIPNAYTETDVLDKVDIGTIKIEQKEKTFTVQDEVFKFSSFKNSDKITVNYGKALMDIYAKDGKVQKCVVISEDRTIWNEYDADGNALACTVYTYDEYGNITKECRYGADGALTDFYEATYHDMLIREKREYSGSYDLLKVTKYYYEGTALKTEAVYGPDLKLQGTIEH